MCTLSVSGWFHSYYSSDTPFSFTPTTLGHPVLVTSSTVVSTQRALEGLQSLPSVLHEESYTSDDPVMGWVREERDVVI